MNIRQTSFSEDATPAEARFGFGGNWRNFLSLLDNSRIAQAEQSLRDMLKVDDLRGKRVLDIGSGSGLFSLAAHRLGAEVHSFDYDRDSVSCTAGLQQKFFPGDPAWLVERGDILDQEYIRKLGQFDIVYSWGVLHHTGQLWQAIDNAAGLVKPGGKFFIAIYNDQGWISRYWLAVKKLWNRSAIFPPLLTTFHTPYLYAGRMVIRTIRRKGSLGRGMSLWHDMIDWLGGLPFEVARPEQITAFALDRGFSLINLKTCGGRHGCNEFVFERQTNG